jgi:phosphate transport system protein
MSKRFQKEVAKLHEKLLSLGVMVESRVRQAISAFMNRDMEQAKAVIKADVDIDTLEVEIEEDCLKLLALYQPVAKDLRFLVATIKINNDLERVGDESVNIAQRCLVVLKYPPMDIHINIKQMAENVQKMLRSSLDALVYKDLDLAYRVCIQDDTIDNWNRKNYEIIKDELNKCQGKAGLLLNMLLISRHLERIADHATNIAEEVILILEGEIPRHRFANKGEE